MKIVKIGCPELTRDRYCEKHRKEAEARYEQDRGTKK